MAANVGKLSNFGPGYLALRLFCTIVLAFGLVSALTLASVLAELISAIFDMSEILSAIMERVIIDVLQQPAFKWWAELYFRVKQIR
ncbi:hypothetical protein [Amygdalobacter nucleatus]|uniref:Uncharacterized protein n=1 Tax=Amygdalobacter nucleatus TaxID=3029274 RepID=A0A133YHM1_9FIRM|nr:hypothetical protein [Amygdalobacter nucleatus]KXB42695.1 hypothetical protein HMPREF1872_00031 [Amygdalobacter nucleatus]MDF0486241.1 hypothetical protein [Amygdalobacter nucleatus]WEG37202.1 hypothetical protein PYS63_01815 [Amygdalobacter nucleatus]